VIVGIPNWAGTMTLEFGECFGYVGTVNQCYNFTAIMDLVLMVDENNSNPGVNNPNVTGTGSVTFSPVQLTDDDIYNSPSLSCPTEQRQGFFASAQTFPFTSEIIGVQAANVVGQYDLLLHFSHPASGLGAVIASFEQGNRKFCEGEIVSTTIEPDPYYVYWNPGIEHDWDPLWADDFGFRLNLTGEDVIYKTGQCGSFYNGNFISPYGKDKCNYTLSLMKI